jgi:lysylphosphatidylglycerol synthetase-like protein (DUF2156 family)
VTYLNRPIGVTLLAVLHVLQAIVLILGGLALVVLGEFRRRGLFGAPRFLSGLLPVIGVVLVVIALLYLGLAWGLWVGKGWAWVLSLVLAALGIIVSLLSIVRGRFAPVIVLVLDGLIAFYLFRPNVRAFFGEQRTAAQLQPITAVPPTVQQTPGPRYCSNCGAPLQGGEKFCSHCGRAVL